MKKILPLCIIFSLTFCLASIAMAENNCPYDNDYKYAFQKALVDYLKDPKSSQFSLNEIKSMILFYLQPSIIDSDCPANVIALLQKAEQVPDNVMARFSSKDMDTCDTCPDGAVCNQKNDKGQTCTCIDVNKNGKSEFCLLKPYFPTKETCDICPDGTFCGQSNQKGQTCDCKYTKGDGKYEYCMLGPLNPSPTPTPNPTPSSKKCDDSTGCKIPHAVPGCTGANTVGCLEDYCTNGVQYTYVCDSNNNCVPGSTQKCPSGTCEAPVDSDKWSHQCSGNGPTPIPTPSPTPNSATCSGTGYECRPIYTGSDQSKACTSVAGKPAWDYVGTGKSAGCSDPKWPNCCKDPGGPGPNPNPECSGSCEAIYLGTIPSDQTQQQYTCSRLGKAFDSTGYCSNKMVCCGSSTPTPDSGKCFDTDNGRDPALSGICSKGTNHITDKCAGDSSINEAFCDGGEKGSCAVNAGMPCPANTVCKSGARGDACVPKDQNVMALDINLPKTGYKTCEESGPAEKDMYVKALDERSQGLEHVNIQVSCSDAGVTLNPPSAYADDGKGGAWFRFRAPYATGHDAPFQIVMTANGKQDDPAKYAPATVSKTLTITPRELVFVGDITTDPDTKDKPAHPCDKIKFKACIKAKDPIADDLLIDYAGGITITFNITLNGKDEAKTCKVDKSGCCQTDEWVVPDSITDEKEVTVKASAKGNCYMETKPPKEYKFKVKPVPLLLAAGVSPNPVKVASTYTINAIVTDDTTKPIDGVEVLGSVGMRCVTDGSGKCSSPGVSGRTPGTLTISLTATKKCFKPASFTTSVDVVK